jgi:Fe-S-cluster containining protein
VIRAAENAARVQGNAPATYPPVPCAFLEEGLCLVHEARPLACRRHHSLDRGPCREAFETGTEVRAPINAKVWAAGTGISAAYAEGLKRAKVDAAIYELQQATHIALGDPGAGDRWLAGESVFGAAKSLEKTSFADMKRRFPSAR